MSSQVVTTGTEAAILARVIESHPSAIKRGRTIWGELYAKGSGAALYS